VWIGPPPQAAAAAPPTAELDADWDFAAVPIVAAMTWPRSARRQSEATATFAAQMMGFVDAVFPEVLARGLPAGIEGAAKRLGVTPGEVLSMPHVRELVAEAFRVWPDMQAEFRSRIEHELFRPAGGFQTVAAAPGAAVLTDEIRKAAGGGAFACGLLLLVVARMAAFHPSVPASLNRAHAVLEAWRAAHPHFSLPADRTIKEAWKEWGGVAPLWAALAGTIEVAAQGAPNPEEAAYQAFERADMRRQMIGWAKWFRRFAVSHTPKGASKPLLIEREAVLITGGVPEKEPPIGPLPPALLQAAAAYRAPKNIW